MRLEEEYANLRSALEWAQRSGALDLGARLALAMRLYWYKQGQVSEARSWLDALLAGDDRAGCVVSPTVRADLLREAGLCALRQGDHGRARELLENSIALARGAGDEQGLADALLSLGNTVAAQGAYARAMDLYQVSLALDRKAGNAVGMAATLTSLGDVALARGDYRDATVYYEDALALNRAAGDAEGIAFNLHGLGRSTG